MYNNEGLNFQELISRGLFRLADLGRKRDQFCTFEKLFSLT